MSSVWSIASSGVNTALLGLSVSAQNTANLETPDFHRHMLLQRDLADGGVTATVAQADYSDSGNLLAAGVQQLMATSSFKANLRMVQTADTMVGSVLKVKT